MTEFALTAEDVVVTVPRDRWDAWLCEGDLPGQTETGEDWHYYCGGSPPLHLPKGSRVYVVAGGRLRGYAPLVRIERLGKGSFAFVRRGGAVAVTISESIQGFRGWRHRWWDRADEVPFLGWRNLEAQP